MFWCVCGFCGELQVLSSLWGWYNTGERVSWVLVYAVVLMLDFVMFGVFGAFPCFEVFCWC